MISPEAIGILGFLGVGLVLFFVIARMWRRAHAAALRLVDRLPPPEQVLNLAYPPSRIELLSCPEIPWSNPAHVAASAQRLRGLGFQDAGCYQNSENRDAYGWAFVHPSVGVTVVWMSFAGKMDYFEMATHYADGTSFALANGPLVGLLARPSHWTVRGVPETDPASVYERMLTERPEKPVEQRGRTTSGEAQGPHSAAFGSPVPLAARGNPLRAHRSVAARKNNRKQRIR